MIEIGTVQIDAQSATIIAVGTIIASVLFFILWMFAQARLGKIRKRYAPIIDQEATLTKLQNEETKLALKIEEIRHTYREKRKILEQLETQVAIYDEKLAFAELGVYEPHFDFTDSEIFKNRIKEIRDQQKAMISNKTATICPSTWTIDGSVSKGRTMMNRQTRLSLRAFNNECDVAIANTRWNNINAMEKRIYAAEKAINAQNSSMNLEISGQYVELKIDELRLTHEYREQQKIEK